jgi:hypothetical protein
MHDEIIRYTISGEVSDRKLPQIKQSMIEFLETQMRDDGIVPSLDLEPQFTREYNVQTDRFEFSLTVYGVFVGGEEAWPVAGVMSGTKILKYTPQAKSKEF